MIKKIVLLICIKNLWNSQKKLITYFQALLCDWCLGCDVRGDLFLFQSGNNGVFKRIFQERFWSRAFFSFHLSWKAEDEDFTDALSLSAKILLPEHRI